VKRREFISLFAGVAAAWSVAANAEELAPTEITKPSKATLPQIEVPRVKPVDRMPPNVRLSDDLIDLMKGLAFRAPRALVVPGGHHWARRPSSTNVSASGKLVYGRSSTCIRAPDEVIE
jgi:hypothetical protein